MRENIPTPETPTVGHAKNVAFSDTITPQYKNLGMEDFVNFFNSCPLHYVLRDVPEPLFPKQVCGFYYSYTVDESGKTISRTMIILGFTTLQPPLFKFFVFIRWWTMKELLLKPDFGRFYLMLIMISLI
ncbi:unnamed protein product [Lactuca saligna]|uniref:Uncharacterized protein n=1 Tax=Lactuca saligna TaxID=75948 RepID=A0AA35ZJG6_LACSI|nr:unnamed protein product [Lactuca saligna]